MPQIPLSHGNFWALNESPSEKEGKSPPASSGGCVPCPTLNESPSEKEGKSGTRNPQNQHRPPSMKVPPKRKGNYPARFTVRKV